MTNKLDFEVLASLIHWEEYYENTQTIHKLWTSKESFSKFLKRQRKCFGDAVVTLRNGVYLKPEFEARMLEWVVQPKGSTPEGSAS